MSTFITCFPGATATNSCTASGTITIGGYIASVGSNVASIDIDRPSYADAGTSLSAAATNPCTATAIGSIGISTCGNNHTTININCTLTIARFVGSGGISIAIAADTCATACLVAAISACGSQLSNTVNGQFSIFVNQNACLSHSGSCCRIDSVKC